MRILYGKDGKTYRSDQWPEHADTIWVDVGPDDRSALGHILNKLYPAHPAAVQKVLNGQDQRPGLLVEPKAVTAMLDHPEGQLETLRTQPVGLVVGHQFLVTTHLDGQNPLLDQVYDHVLHQNGLGHGIDLVLFHYLDLHVGAWRKLVSEISQAYEQIHHRMLNHPYHNLAHNILTLRRRTMRVRRSVRPEQEIFILFGSQHFPYARDEDRLYFKDLEGRMSEIIEDLDGYRDGLSESVEAYTSMQSNEINKVMRVLTVISVLALPATTIASIYGMNFDIPEIHWKYGYWYSLVLMATTTAAVFIYMKRHDHL
jgi:magnesium transporter